MGSGSWSSSTYKAFADSYTKKSREEIFHQRSLHEEMDLTKSKTHIRESRDSEEHPESLPVFIALDETGSMGSIHRYSELFDFDTTYYATKHRISRDKLEVKLPSRIKPNTSILVFDDLCDGGGTFFAIYKALQDMGVTDVHLRVTHAIQKEPLVKLSELYKTITITNSYKDWDKEELPNNIKVIKVYE